VGTQGTVKGLTQQALGELGVQILLGKHISSLSRRGTNESAPGRAASFHVLAGRDPYRFRRISGIPVLPICAKVTDDGVIFRSHLDGSEHSLTPEKSIEIQQALGSDIAMVLDECIEYPADHERAAAAVRRTTEWAPALP